MQFEDALISQLKAALPQPSLRVLVGIGDDAAVTRPPINASVATTDTMVEGVHFDFNFCSPFEVGTKAVHVNVSDLAAQGAKPLSLLVSLVLPPKYDVNKLIEIYMGLGQTAQKLDIDVIGGNIASTRTPSPLILQITALGQPFEFMKAESTPCRGNLKADDWIAITGPLGLAAAGLLALQKLGKQTASAKYPRCVERYLTPTARLQESFELLRSSAVTSMMDISDGLALDLKRLGGGQNFDLILNEQSLFIHPEIRQLSLDLGLSKTEVQNILFGGDDYELLLTLDPNTWKNAVVDNLSLKDSVQIIGDVHDGASSESTVRLWLDLESGGRVEIPPKGWDHLPPS